LGWVAQRQLNSTRSGGIEPATFQLPVLTFICPGDQNILTILKAGFAKTSAANIIAQNASEHSNNNNSGLNSLAEKIHFVL